MGDFYEDLLIYKSTKKLNFKELGDIVDKSEDAFRMAIKRKSLTALEITELKKMFETEQPNQVSESETTYQQDLAEYNLELKKYEAKTIDELRDIAYKFLANESKLYEHSLLPDNREMHFWLRYKEIIDEYGSIDNFLNKEV